MQDAYNTYRNDKTIWKISYQDEFGNPHRWVTKIKCQVNYDMDESLLCQKNQVYENCGQYDNQFFWVDQPLTGKIEYIGHDATIGEHPIFEVLTDQEFRQKFKIN